MAPTVQILPISDASDGVGSAPVGRATAKRDDAHYLEKIADKWAKDQNLPAGAKYRLDRLPSGYSGWACPREKKPKHEDRYLYGHPNGYFRSINELYPHFVHLQNFGGSVGCECKLCTGKSKTAKIKASSGSSNNSASISSTSPGEQLRFWSGSRNQPASSSKPQPKKRSSDELPSGRLPSNSPSAKRRKHTDDEGTPDLYRGLINELREAGEQGLQKEIAEQMSPDWRAGQDMLQRLLSEWPDLPSFVSRVGELVLFARNVSSEETVAWDSNTQALRRVDVQSKAWLERLKWEAGVVTQMPTEPISIDDLARMPEGKKNVTYSGFRVEPLSQPGHQSKSYTKQHKYIPLHAIRPFSFWKECLAGVEESDWHPTIKHALTVANSFSIIGRYSFKGVWPEAAIFARGVYVGPELLMVGDTVRLLPAKPDSKKPVEEILFVTSIRLRFIKLDQAEEEDYEDSRGYQSCLHFTGKAFTLDPKRSFGGIAGAPVQPGQNALPAGLAGFGRWFSMVDPNDSRARLEVPFSRLLGRCIEHEAIKSWFRTPTEMPPPPSSFQAVNATSNGKVRVLDLSQGLVSTREARKYSVLNDPRIDKQFDKTWFWAESRIEQLDLHEVNGRFVGPRDETRTSKQMNAWRQALKLLDGKKGGFEQYQAALKQRREEQQHHEPVPTSAFGMMAMAVDHHDSSATDAEKMVDNDDGDDDMDAQADMKRAGASEAIEISDDEDEVEVD